MPAEVVAVDDNGEKRISGPEVASGRAVPSEPPRSPAPRFMYASGSRPLDGFTIKRGVGYGGFGEIYYAISDAGKEVALKLVRRNLDVELRGIRHCLNLKHPNLVALYDIRRDGQGDTWVVMEYVSGCSLADAIAAHPDGMAAQDALAWLHGIAAGVGHLHDHGIVHRDLKPANIFSEEGLVKVGDYGLSKFISCSRRSGQTESIGTVHYMAPEVANGRYGKEIDIYAMGVILYEMLTGCVPFDGESVGEVLMKHLTGQPDLSMLAEPLRSVVARALEKDPAKRFASVAEMMADLPAAAGSNACPPPESLVMSSTGSSTAGGAPARPLAETVVFATVVEDEPILRSLRETWWRMRAAWDQANLPMPLKIVLMLAAIWALLISAHFWIPLGFGLCILYGIYRLARAFIMIGAADGTRGAPAPAVPVARGEVPAPGPTAPVPRHVPQVPPSAVRHKPRTGIREQAAPAMVLKPVRERFTDLVGSLLISALVTMAMCVVMVLLYNFSGNAAALPEQCAWLFLVSLAGSWTVLIAAKFWEGTRGDPARRRFILLVLGLGLGLVSAGTASALLVHLPAGADFPQPDHPVPQGFYDDAGRPLVLSHLAVFGTLMLLLRWWRQADPLRSSRLSLRSLVLCGVVAGVVAAGWHFPQPWLPMVAATMSVAVQLSSPWVAPPERRRLKG